MLHESRNMTYRDNMLLTDGLRALRRRLPAGSGVRVGHRRLPAANRRTGSIAVEARATLDPKGVQPLVERARSAQAELPLVVLSRYLSGATRERLRSREVGYLDLTGNAWLVVPEPGLFIETQGASEDPDRKERPARSLRGPKAGRIIRALIDRRQPPGVRELAVATKTDASYVSRVLAFLDSEALVTRVGHGRLESVDWPALMRRWAQEAPLESRGKTRMFLEPRGLTGLVGRLAESEEHYAITSSLAAATFAPVAPARLVVIWVRDAAQAAARLALRPTETGANVLLVEPADESVFEGATQRDGVWYAAPSQVAADLLTSPGRGPAEGEELINWMRANEDAWRQ